MMRLKHKCSGIKQFMFISKALVLLNLILNIHAAVVRREIVIASSLNESDTVTTESTIAKTTQNVIIQSTLPSSLSSFLLDNETTNVKLSSQLSHSPQLSEETTSMSPSTTTTTTTAVTDAAIVNIPSAISMNTNDKIMLNDSNKMSSQPVTLSRVTDKRKTVIGDNNNDSNNSMNMMVPRSTTEEPTTIKILNVENIKNNSNNVNNTTLTAEESKRQGKAIVVNTIAENNTKNDSSEMKFITTTTATIGGFNNKIVVLKKSSSVSIGIYNKNNSNNQTSNAIIDINNNSLSKNDEQIKGSNTENILKEMSSTESNHIDQIRSTLTDNNNLKNPTIMPIFDELSSSETVSSHDHHYVHQENSTKQTINNNLMSMPTIIQTNAKKNESLSLTNEIKNQTTIEILPKQGKFIDNEATNMTIPDRIEVWALAGMKNKVSNSTLRIKNDTSISLSSTTSERTKLNDFINETTSPKLLTDWTNIMRETEIVDHNQTNLLNTQNSVENTLESSGIETKSVSKSNTLEQQQTTPESIIKYTKQSETIQLKIVPSLSSNKSKDNEIPAKLIATSQETINEKNQIEVDEVKQKKQQEEQQENFKSKKDSNQNNETLTKMTTTTTTIWPKNHMEGITISSTMETKTTTTGKNEHHLFTTSESSSNKETSLTTDAHKDIQKLHKENTLNSLLSTTEAIRSQTENFLNNSNTTTIKAQEEISSFSSSSSESEILQTATPVTTSSRSPEVKFNRDSLFSSTETNLLETTTVQPPITTPKLTKIQSTPGTSQQQSTTLFEFSHKTHQNETSGSENSIESNIVDRLYTSTISSIPDDQNAYSSTNVILSISTPTTSKINSNLVDTNSVDNSILHSTTPAPEITSLLSISTTQSTVRYKAIPTKPVEKYLIYSSSIPTETIESTTSDKTVMISENHTILTSPADVDGTNMPNETDYNVIIAISVSAVGIIALILLVGFLYVMRKRQKRLTYGQRCRPVSLDAYSLDNVSVYNSVRRKGALRASKRSYGNVAFDDPALKHNLLNVQELAKFMEKKSNIYEEFKDVPQIIARPDEVPPGCEDKNRYANVIPLPETRVMLQRENDDEKTEYINANYVKGPKDSSNYYIACQAPLENTVIDFWRMIWQQNSRVIIMATDFIENGIEKCYEYLPQSIALDNHLTFGCFQITLKSREVKDKYAVSVLHLKNTITNISREITHFWYKWPETGVPNDETSIIAMLLEARSCLKNSPIDENDDQNLTNTDETITRPTKTTTIVNNTPNVEEIVQKNSDINDDKEGSNETIATNGHIEKLKSSQKSQGLLTVHCSPGTGRTGAIIASDIVLRSLETPKRSVDIPEIVYYVRCGRASAVQTKEQYEFIYRVANMYASKISGPVNDN